jgi:hypothetical protein|tara:strand:+ start:1546 stop:1770 length:225 start_codon:yes stop_codon:yes gene_type:complete
MRRYKGQHKKSHKTTARSHLHSFRSSSHAVAWNDPISNVVKEKAAEQLEAIKAFTKVATKTVEKVTKANHKKGK